MTSLIVCRSFIKKKRVTLEASFESPTGEKATAVSMLTSAVKEKAAFQNKMLSTLHEIRDLHTIPAKTSIRADHLEIPELPAG